MGDCSESVGLYGNRSTLDRNVSYRSAKVDAHATARMLFDNLARDPEETTGDFEVCEAKNEGFEECEDLLLCGSGVEGDTVFESSSPVDKFGEDVDDETSAWIECNQSCSSWIDDVYEKPYMVGAGLDNLGNTCFFNAVMQCFTHTMLLVQGLYAYMHPTPCDCSNERFCLLCALREHIELSLSSNGKSVAPWKFVDNLSYFSSAFLRYQQEDAHEFLQCFLDRLESCLTNLKTKDDALPSQSFNLVKQVFGGRVISKLRCCNCNHVSDTYEPSVDLSLEIEDVNSLSTALESFTKVEHIEDEEMKFTCDHCKQKVSVEKQLMLDQIPPVCAFHLKRFKNDGSYVEKIDKHVEFPLELDLQPYTSGIQNNNMDFTYELYAVVVHAGFSSSSGHYYSYVRSAPDTWYKFDDRKVTYVSEACVLSEEAYILFYAKQGTPWFSNFLETFKPSLNSNLSNTSPKSVLENVDPLNIHPFDINATKNDLPQSDEVAPAPLTPVGNPRKENIPLTLKEYGSNHRIKVETNIPTSDPKTELDTPDQVPSPSTPPVSPELYFSDDDDISGVVFAPKPKQLKLAKKATSKRLRDNEVAGSAKREALKICRRMPGSRGKLLISAMSSDGSRKNHSKSCDRF
ncbi:putative ubiquitinyl hydrolase 1 [Helianthus annuus]|uniref:Ubiquitin carboxyl-terminal hydrolase n=1 Tax=Helianthus annuus TaxID=4232 RepID=A0A251RLD0_HELAN|nr:ubiquitin carboxyl-terminal hydrolase 20-like isoform X1 [Helianthus annuus]XP_035842525.1 ubiquitin carboxyl-terminal hydrolase 20-like isoform X2 [Helianthus annuus]KAF5753591.1 putative ubiquitinyl hydrolase 1 [Helianthus annuus]KAJ0431493.1 putative ubiquitinyl hydrolase 1 [Helianthus annuus]KAJ0445948.1 putative ubiquitinyl hydrolase 1 [Helianthus annuus]